MRESEDAPEGAEMREAVRATYGPDDLSGNPVFAGGFINFGHWAAVDLDRPLGEPERVRSQEDLYRHVLDARGTAAGETLLEVGCGLGMGAALTVREYAPARVTALDIHPEQLARARRAHADLLAAEPARLRFVRGAAERMPLPDAAYDTVLSVEAVQHVPDLPAFAHETARVLRPGGTVAVASFFTTDDAPGRPAQLARLLDSYATDLDIARSATALTAAFTAAGLTGATAEPIGHHVWAGWDRWLSHWWQPGTWPRNFLHAYEEGILDYYVVLAHRPAGA